MKTIIISSCLVFATLIGHSALAQGGSPLYRSTDNGKSWHTSDQGLNEAVRVDQIMSFKKQYFILTEGQGLYVSSNQGKSWSKPGFSMFLPAKGDVIHAYNDLLWLGTYRDGVLVSADQGNSWVPCIKGLRDLTIRAFHSHEENIWVGTNDGVYLWNATDKAWDQQLEGVQVNDFSQQGNRLFVATHQGMQRSIDQGQHWETVLEEGAVKQLYRWNMQLYACSMHRKIWRYDPAKDIWNDATGFFPTAGLSTTILHGDEEVIYVTQERKLYRKFTTQGQWELVSNGLSNAAAFRDLTMVQPGVLLLACTAKP